MEVIVRRDTFDVGEEEIINAERGIIIKAGDKLFNINVCGDNKDTVVIYAPRMLVQPLSPSSVIVRSE